MGTVQSSSFVRPSENWAIVFVTQLDLKSLGFFEPIWASLNWRTWQQPWLSFRVSSLCTIWVRNRCLCVFKPVGEMRIFHFAPVSGPFGYLFASCVTLDCVGSSTFHLVSPISTLVCAAMPLPCPSCILTLPSWAMTSDRVVCSAAMWTLFTNHQSKWKVPGARRT